MTHHEPALLADQGYKGLPLRPPARRGQVFLLLDAFYRTLALTADARPAVLSRLLVAATVIGPGVAVQVIRQFDFVQNISVNDVLAYLTFPLIVVALLPVARLHVAPIHRNYVALHQLLLRRRTQPLMLAAAGHALGVFAVTSVGLAGAVVAFRNGREPFADVASGVVEAVTAAAVVAASTASLTAAVCWRLASTPLRTVAPYIVGIVEAVRFVVQSNDALPEALNAASPFMQASVVLGLMPWLDNPHPTSLVVASLVVLALCLALPWLVLWSGRPTVRP